MGDMRRAFRDAHVRQWEAFKRSGRLTEAARVAELLRSEYGHEVDGGEPADQVAQSLTYMTENYGTSEDGMPGSDDDEDDDES